MNVELLEKVRDHILSNPHLFSMYRWGDECDCGTTGCIGGWTLVLSGRKKLEDLILKHVLSLEEFATFNALILDEACNALCITPKQGRTLFYSSMWPWEMQCSYYNHQFNGEYRKAAEVAATMIQRLIDSESETLVTQEVEEELELVGV